ncbi:MAG: hypothetical protein K2Y28_03760 [Burkholderiaceae bacterium]|nr:hypothetical protein [Burkholderiaceae bacterium]
MPITSTAFVASRNYVYHVCGAVNFKAIQTTRTLQSAERILSISGHDHLLQGKRDRTVEVRTDDGTVQVRDHKPLIQANMELIDGYSFDDFLRELNSRVFLWAGTEAGPCKSGKNHIAKYASEGAVFILRVPTRSLLEINGFENLDITFCNSGSARQIQGKKVKRGRSTFMKLATSNRPPGEVVEVTFEGSALLPIETEYAKELSGPWLPLAAGA